MSREILDVALACNCMTEYHVTNQKAVWVITVLIVHHRSMYASIHLSMLLVNTIPSVLY